MGDGDLTELAAGTPLLHTACTRAPTLSTINSVCEVVVVVGEIYCQYYLISLIVLRCLTRLFLRLLRVLGVFGVLMRARVPMRQPSIDTERNVRATGRSRVTGARGGSA